MNSSTSLDYALKLLKEDSRISEITQGPVSIVKLWAEDESLQVYLDEGGKIVLDNMVNDPWNIVYTVGAEA